jgi:hypothetical protein
MLVPLDEFGYRVSLDATNGVVHGKFLRQADVFGFGVVFLRVFVVADDGTIVFLVFRTQAIGLEMVVDEDDGVTLDSHLIRNGAVVDGLIVNPLAGNNGIFRQKGHETVRVFLDVAIGIEILKRGEGLLNVRVRRLLQTNEVSIALGQILDNGILFPRHALVIAKAHHIIRQDFETPSWRIHLHIEGNVGTDALRTKQHPHDRDDDALPLEHEPEQDKEDVDSKKNREHQPKVREFGIVLRWEHGGVSTKNHCHHKKEVDGNEDEQGYFLQQFHSSPLIFLLALKSVAFSLSDKF